MPNKVETLEKARDFTVFDIYGNEVSILNASGKKVILSFFRYTECIFCNLHLRKLLQALSQVDRESYEFIAVFQSPTDDVHKHFGEKMIDATVIADPSRRLYKLYAVEEKSISKFLSGAMRLDRFFYALFTGIGVKVGHGSKFLVPADFLINESGIIEEAYYGKDISDHLAVSRVVKFLLNKKHEYEA